MRNQRASQSLFILLPHLSAIFHCAPVSECIFSGNKLEQLRMTRLLQEFQHRLLESRAGRVGEAP